MRDDDRIPDGGGPDQDRCGAPTTTGKPCHRGPNCPYHQQNDAPETGRPTKLTRDRQERIASMLEKGHSINAATRANGISAKTYHEWVRRGENQDEGIFREFRNRVTRARAEGERRYIEKAQDAAIQSKNAQALLRMAQLQYPDSWGEDTEVASSRSGSLNVYLSADEERETDEYKLAPDDEKTVSVDE
jgi:transposase